ncbi:YXWGXW repeat-containing protein [Aerosticca soli]|jgi:hypothetical protein|uniref:YXWGXW repeat-containing protein n=1 Tax=Aerosticca soli TaxID=2010829 RepID=UPI000F83C33A|nr:YXWGXW repeat-containing protein [Aerosticca soli]MDI3261693.1 YXWGXW repeat-containing protein [Fulvimonas sp.]
MSSHRFGRPGFVVVLLASALALAGCVVVPAHAPERVWVPGHWAGPHVWVEGHWRYR